MRALATSESNSNPAMATGSVIRGDKWRIGMLTDSLVRFEWSDTGVFEDNASQFATNRSFDVPDFHVTDEGDDLKITTPTLEIFFRKERFSAQSLWITVKQVSRIWHYGDKPNRNLGGTARTLDEANGSVPLEPGILSTDGWAIVDDSTTNVLLPTRDTDPAFSFKFMPRAEGTTDFYFFGYGHRYKDAIRDYYQLSGVTPLLPRFALGNWWSRNHEYSADEYLSLLDEFNAQGIPFSTAVLDMAWHLTTVDPKYGTGWTGYTWNKELFPNPAAFLEEIHKRGMRTTLNVHPADGIRAFEDRYERAAEIMGIDPATEQTVPFDASSEKSLKAYFDLHHGLEHDGVDFWWVDWQQGAISGQKNLDPLWVLNHMHFLDTSRNGGRSLTFSRYAGPGSHRYPIGFSGDTIVTWKSLDFQPYFTSTASNIGYGWWSHDIGGHMFGYRDEELEARWYQLGVFSPITRLHSTNSDFNRKEPWRFGPVAQQSMTRSLRLRHQLIPYLYAMNWRAHSLGLPLVEPMYWDAPENDLAYQVKNEYRFGTELIVSPITHKSDASIGKAKADVWLPQGTWFDFFTGRKYLSSPVNGRVLEAWRSLDTLPVFARAGGIIPLRHNTGTEPINDVGNPAALEILVFPDSDGNFSLIEDNGRGMNEIKTSTTQMDLRYAQDGSCEFTITQPSIVPDFIPAQREWIITFRGVENIAFKVITKDTATTDGFTHSYDEGTHSLSVHLSARTATGIITIAFPQGLSTAENPIVSDSFNALYSAQIPYAAKERAQEYIEELGKGALPTLHAQCNEAEESDLWLPHAMVDVLTEILYREE